MGNCCCPGSSANSQPPDSSAAGSSRPLGGGGSTTGPTPTGVVSATAAPTPTKPPAPIGPVLGRPMEDVKTTYTIGKELGRGQFGVTSLCTHKVTGQKFACKTISKRKLSTKEDIEDVRREVQIMDLKPENFLLLSKDENAPLKATDFGLSVFFKEGEVFRDIVGSAYYIAPEVLKRSYGPEADIWSVGVIVYILLCESEHGIFNAILRGQVDFTSDPWPRISQGAKDLVRKMLNPDPKQRISAYDVLNHPWIKEDGEAPDTPLDNAVLGRLKQFRAMNQFKKAALRVIAGCLSEEEIRGLKEMFKSMDSDNSGTITVDELRRGLAKKGTKLTEAEVQQLMEAADADGNGTIDYEEFITATMHMNRMDRDEHLYTAFQYFDKDNSGYITMEELEQALREKGLLDGRDIKDIVAEVDADNDGRINYTEFAAMMRKGDPEPANPKKRRDVVL
nr:unnamed protein product [Digitaria exilis]